MTTPETVEHEPEDWEKRVVVKFFHEKLGSPREEDWEGYGGTIARIRQELGASAPSRQMVYRTLIR